MNIRDKRNIILFIISYLVNNLVSGILYDTYVNYLQEVSLGIATSFWSFYGYATFISAFILMFAPKTGYKKLLLFCSLSCSAAMFAAVFFNSGQIFYLTTILSLTGVQLHFIMLAPFVATYAKSAGDKDIDWYTRTYYIGYIGYFATTYLGGYLTVKMFASRAGITFDAAKKLTAYVAEMAPEIRMNYLHGNEDVFLIFGIISSLAIIPILMMKESRDDFADSVEDNLEKISNKKADILAILFKRDAVIYLVYWTIISFAMGLFTSYYTVFLNRNLHIDKATSSLMVSISYIAIVIFMFFTPFVVRKLGTVGTVCFTVIGSVPFMLIIANGDLFGNKMIPVVGFALFMRAGLANLGSPAESALTMSIMPQSLRASYTAVVNFLAGFISILSGQFTGKVLFVTQEGYKTAYYMAAVLYFIAALVMYAGLKKYNRKKAVD